MTRYYISYVFSDEDDDELVLWGDGPFPAPLVGQSVQVYRVSGPLSGKLRRGPKYRVMDVSYCVAYPEDGDESRHQELGVEVTLHEEKSDG